MSQEAYSSSQNCSNAKPCSQSAPERPQAHGWTPSQFRSLNAKTLRAHHGDVAATSANEGQRKHNVREYSLGEEIANSITHGIGALLAIAAIPILVVHAARDGGGVFLFAALVYTITMLLEYTMSTLYHALAADKAKRVFKVLDHSCIYLLIAGTFTPFCLLTLAPYGGVYLFAFIWIVAVVGIAVEAFWVFRPRWLSALLYLLMGWSIAIFIPKLFDVLPASAFWLLVAGGVAYSIGCIFYVLKKIPYMHSIFHVWVLAGSVLQFLAIAIYVI